jgi:DNA-binding MarR family transcriptional regulator
VRLTPKGQQQFAALAGAHAGWVAEILSGFGADETEDLLALLTALTTNVRDAARPVGGAA